LIDCPVEMGTFASASFDVLGVPHEIAITGRVPNLDPRRIAIDLAKVCAAQIRLFEPRTRKAPVDRYTFLVQAVDDLQRARRERVEMIGRQVDPPDARPATRGDRQGDEGQRQHEQREQQLR
jgi:hypothetical protein